MANIAVNNAISRSIACNECVWISNASDETLSWLRRMSDDYAENGDVTEFWGALDGQEWRVHVEAAPLP